jgi:hypothetical protein
MDYSQLYLELSDYYDHRGEAQSRDRFLVLAADAAMIAGDKEEAEHLRQRLLTLNPHHLLKPFKSFEEAQRSRDVTDYINALRRRHPADQVANLVETTVRPKGGKTAQPERNSQLPPSPQQPARGETASGPRPVDVFRMRPADEPPPTSVRPRPIPPPPSIPSPPPSNPGRMRPAPSGQSTPLSLPPLPFQPEPSRPTGPSPFRPGQLPSSQPTVPVYQGIRLPTTPGSWFCSVIFVVLLVGGIGLTIYSLGRVFLPSDLINLHFVPNRE